MIAPDHHFSDSVVVDSGFDGQLGQRPVVEKIRGKAFRIYWSWSGQGNWTEWVRWERFGKAIQ